MTDPYTERGEGSAIADFLTEHAQLLSISFFSSFALYFSQWPLRSF